MSKICLALDGLSLWDAQSLISKLGNRCFAIKIHDLLDDRGPSVIKELKLAGATRVWVDYKVKDTTDTVALRVDKLVKNGADIVTVHAAGGVEMMRMARAATMANPPGPYGRAKIWAITLLTSLSPEEIGRIHGRDRTPREIALELALMATEARLDGVVCSAQEVGTLRQSPELARMELVVPGTRSAGVELGQQKRSGTPTQAMSDGATFLVAGSQVTKAADPVSAFMAMAKEIGMPV